MNFADNILPAMAAIPVAGFILREWICLMLLPSIEPDRESMPPEKESGLKRPKILIMKPDLSLMLAKAYREGATEEELNTAIRTVLARHRIENKKTHKLEIESNE